MSTFALGSDVPCPNWAMLADAIDLETEWDGKSAASARYFISVTLARPEEPVVTTVPATATEDAA